LIAQKQLARTYQGLYSRGI